MAEKSESTSYKKHAAATKDRDKLLQDLAKWLDVNTIAEAIVDRMEIEEVEVNLEAAKTVWESVLEVEMNDVLESRVQELLDNEKLKPAVPIEQAASAKPKWQF
ncbi:MAG TPA: hypothetical protein VMW64_00940 [Dehalococcoidia bacterium]|nr:hypothetical protein [Dehalococcoidia bacterium]